MDEASVPFAIVLYWTRKVPLQIPAPAPESTGPAESDIERRAAPIQLRLVHPSIQPSIHSSIAADARRQKIAVGQSQIACFEWSGAELSSTARKGKRGVGTGPLRAGLLRAGTGSDEIDDDDDDDGMALGTGGLEWVKLLLC